MSFWSRILPWRARREPAPFVPVYPELRLDAERVVVAAAMPPEPIRQYPKPKPARKRYAGTKPWNKIKAAQKIAAGVLDEIRSADFDAVYTIPEIDEWIEIYCRDNGLNIGGLTFCAIRTAMKRCSGVRFENRRLLSDPAYHYLRNRHKAHKRFIPARAWIFIIDAEPEHVEAEAQPNRRAA